MKSVFLILFALAVYCNAAATRGKPEKGCTCADLEVGTNDALGTILGKCRNSDKLGPNRPKEEYWCYVDREECKTPDQEINGELVTGIGNSSRFTNRWVSYELCNCQNNPDCDENTRKSPGTN